MEQQPLRRRRPESVRFPVSSPDLSDIQLSRPISDGGGVRPVTTSRGEPALQSTDDSQSSADDQLAQSRRLQLRQARFRGLAILPRSITPTSGALTLMNNGESPSPDAIKSSPSEVALDSKMRRASNDLGILQEVSNSTLGRKRSRRQDENTHTDMMMHDMAPEESKKLTAYVVPAETQSYPSSNVGSTIMANSSLPLRSDALKTPRARLRAPRASSTPQRPAGADSDKYIEHLESQLAALQTRLQAITSPSTSKTQSAKLRAVTSESRTLRQEVSEWERKFHERISEQLEQNEMVVGSLKAQIKSLQRELESSKERLAELALESADKDRLIMAAEGANYDLERRLEFMSEMLALSPSKVHSHREILVDNRRISAPRPRSRGQTQIPIVHNRQHSLPRDASIFTQRETTSSPENLPTKSMVYAWEDNPFDRSLVEAAALQSAVDSEFTVPETTVSESTPMSPAGRKSYGKSTQSDSDAKNRPTRRMRRFYTGSMGPRSLILPSATHPPSLAPSPPRTGTETPRLTSDHSEIGSGQAYHFGFKLPVSPERPHIHVRSATWDDNEAAASQSRKGAVSHTPLPLPSPSRSGTFEYSQLSSAPTFLDGDTLTPVVSQRNSAQTVITRDVSFGSMQGRNLFEELSRIKRLSSGGRDRAEMSLPDLLKRGSSPLPEPVAESGIEQIVEDPTTDAVKPVSNPTIDLSLEPDNNCAILINPDHEVQANNETTTTTTNDTEEQKPITLTPQPTSLIDRLLSFISRTLDVSTPSVSQVISNAWSIVTLSRPVLEFRWWLVRLLVGGLRKKRRMKLLAARTPVHGLGISTSPGMVSNGSIDAATSNDKSNDENNNVMPQMVIMKQLRSVQGYNDNNTLDGNSDVDADDETIHHHQCRRSNNNKNNNNNNNTKNKPKMKRNKNNTMPRPVAWLKFSMTLVFAVGVAIKDGPASLFGGRGPDREVEGWAATAPLDGDGGGVDGYDGYGDGDVDDG